jgi:hypothetical protein
MTDSVKSVVRVLMEGIIRAEIPACVISSAGRPSAIFSPQ